MAKFSAIFCFLLFGLISPLFAIDFISTNSYLIAKEDAVADEQWVYALNVDVAGEAQDDLFILAGEQIQLSGVAQQNVWAAGEGQIVVDGEIHRNARLTGRTIQLSGVVKGNVLAAADTIQLSPTVSVDGDVKLFGNSMVVEGDFAGDVSVVASRMITVSGNFAGNVRLVAPEIVLQRDTRIKGNLSYTTNKELILPAGIVAGKLDRVFPSKPPVFSKARIISHITWFFAAFMAGLLFVSFFPITTMLSTQIIRTAPWRCLWVGALFVLVVPMFGMMSLSSFVGIPLGLLLLGFWGASIYISRIVVGLAIGLFILQQKGEGRNRIAGLLFVGLFVLYFVMAIPGVAGSVQIAVVSMGTGALLLSCIQHRKNIVKISTVLDSQKIKEN